MDVIKVLDKLEETYPDAKCELNYSSPFELLVATILSAQCTDIRVNLVTKDLFKRYNKPEDFSSLSEDELGELIKTCGLYKSKSKKIIETSKIILQKHKGQVPNNLEELIGLPGVGRKTANVILSNAFDIDSIAVDTHVFRVSNRIGITDEKDVNKTEFKLMEVIPKVRWSKSHHLFIFHGRRTCKARNPQCNICSINTFCKYYKKHKGEL